MPYRTVAPNVNLHYDELGAGRPVVFLPGWCGSARFFRHQLSLFAPDHHAIALDYRAHGRSTQTLRGHSLSGYGRDLHALLGGMNLDGAVLVGHSMGTFVAWDYLRQFSDERLAGLVVIDQPPCDSRRPDWPYGDDLQDAAHFAVAVQEDQEGGSRELLGLIFKAPSAEPARTLIPMMLAELLRVPAPVAGVMWLDDMLSDARPLLPQVNLPTLLCWGRHSAMAPLATAEFIARAQPDARLVVFEESGHCPFLEEPIRFHEEVADFLSGL